MYQGDFFYYFMIVNDVDGNALQGGLNFTMSTDRAQKPKRQFFNLEAIGNRIEGDCLFKMF